MAVLKLLASQAAISLENAHLYTDLQHAQEYLSEAQGLSHTGSFGRNLSDGEIVRLSETYNIFGLDRSVKPTVERILQLVHPEDQSRVQQFVDRESHEARNWTLDYRLLLDDGTVKHVHVVAHAVEDDSIHARLDLNCLVTVSILSRRF